MLFRISAFGSNSAGQLGIGHRNDTAEPQSCLFERPDDDGNWSEPKSVSSIVAGGNHTLLLTGEGQVWAAGTNLDGRCALPTTTGNVTSFCKVPLPTSGQLAANRVTHVAATWEASIIVFDERLILTCGSGNKGELAQGPNVTASPLLMQTQQLVPNLDLQPRIVKVAAGVNHVLALTADGTVFGWGSSRKGQLGNDLKVDKLVWTPIMIPVPFEVRRIVAGRDYSLLLGSNGSERLLLGDIKHFPQGVDLALRDENPNIQCGWSDIYYLSTTELQAIGRNDRGQLPPKSMPSLIQFAAGSEHCIACTDVNEIVAWGWGEHGNCGSPVDDKGNVSGKVNVVPLMLQARERIICLAAGCATSFVVMEKT